VLFGGRVESAPADVEVHELQGGSERSADDLVALGRLLGGELVG
jgi:hypothetical protein